MLTYLDGIESREGVFVIGATSRPDLIDPAILRPGRLDKIILCDFPNYEERLDILNLYYLKAHSDLNDLTEHYTSIKIKKVLEKIAGKTEYFSGADLQSLIYNAFLISVKRNIKLEINQQAVINEDDLILSFENSKKSVNEKDIIFYKEIKNKFSARLGIDKIISDKTSEKIKNLDENSLKMTFY